MSPMLTVSLTYDLEVYLVVAGGRLPKVDPAPVDAFVFLPQVLDP